jgi:hypothetical protein
MRRVPILMSLIMMEEVATLSTGIEIYIMYNAIWLRLVPFELGNP